jgi:hypothetical protein
VPRPCASGRPASQKALGQAGTRLAVAFSILIEVIRLKLPRTLKNRFDRDFKEGLTEPPTGAAAAAIAATAASHRLAGITYYGQKTHEKKVQTYLEKALRADFTEELLERVCMSLLELRLLRLLRDYTNQGQRRFPQNPFFPFMEAESYVVLGPGQAPVWRIGPCLEKARRLVEALPRDARHKGLLEEIQKRQDMVRIVNPLFGPQGRHMFESMLDQLYDDDDDFDDDDDLF